MARIRSVHPGLFTDEAFIVLGSDAQIFLIGLWTEADDQGVFEWKPMTLRVRLRPGRDGDVVPILKELEAVDCIKKYEVDGRHYGAIRNFRKYQKPKFPNATHPMTDKIRTYVRLPAAISVIDGVEEDEIPPKGENSPQMEEGGDKRKEERRKKKDTPSGVQSSRYVFEAGVIKLVETHFVRWQKSFPHLSLEAELEGLAPWAASQANWFHAVSGALAKRHREVVLKLEKMKLESSQLGPGASPQLWDPGL
jgi:hypothetical protein